MRGGGLIEPGTLHLKCAGGYDVVVGEWAAISAPSGLVAVCSSQIREMSYVMPVRSTLSPVRKTRVHETQRLTVLAVGAAILQTHQVMSDIPYGDYFSVNTKFVISGSQQSEPCAAGGGRAARLRLSLATRMVKAGGGAALPHYP